MKKDKSMLPAFILGMLSIVVFIPIIEGFVDIAINWFEVFKIPPIKRTLKGNKEIQDLQMEQEEIGTQVMGFQYEGDPEYCDDEYDFEDKKENNIKLGFHA